MKFKVWTFIVLLCVAAFSFMSPAVAAEGISVFKADLSFVADVPQPICAEPSAIAGAIPISECVAINRIGDTGGEVRERTYSSIGHISRGPGDDDDPDPDATG